MTAPPRSVLFPRSVGRALVSVFRVDGRGAAKGVSGWSQLLLAAGALALYELAHLITGSQRGPALSHAREVLSFERQLGIDWEHRVQTLSLHHDLLRTAANEVYTWTYWPVILGALILTWQFDRRDYRVLRDGMMLSGGVGLLVFIFYPVAPPRMLPSFTDTIGSGSVEHAVVHGSIADSYAALPSFHVGWVALGAVMLALSCRRVLGSTGRSLARLLAAVVIAAMTAAVVLTANHFVLDAVSGIFVALVGGGVASRLHPVAPARQDNAAPDGDGSWPTVDASEGHRGGQDLVGP